MRMTLLVEGRAGSPVVAPQGARSGVTRRRLHAAAATLAGGSAMAACGVRPGSATSSTAQTTVCRSRLEMFVAAGPGTPRYEAYADALKSFTRPGCTVELSVVPSAELLAKITTAV